MISTKRGLLCIYVYIFIIFNCDVISNVDFNNNKLRTIYVLFYLNVLNLFYDPKFENIRRKMFCIGGKTLILESYKLTHLKCIQKTIRKEKNNTLL